MKNWLTQAAVGLFAVAALASCSKDENKVTVAPSATSTLTASANSAVLTQANAAQTAITFNWTPVTFALSGTDYKKAPAVTYELQVAKSADGFGYPGIISVTGTGTSKAVTVQDLNTALTFLNVTPGVATPVFVRLAAGVGTDRHSFVSNAVPLTVTGYKVCLPPNSDVWSIIGPAGVDWNTDVPLVYNCDTKTYDLTRNLNAGEFKFRKNSDWGVNYGGNSPTGGALVANGSNIAVATPGLYTIKFNLATLTYTVTR
ncbi:SusE domain-containing protein [Hymenobacter sp. 5317J-9]|uniref:SusE domain-containing protein n=1 Tax=Hymenobacter sp. 5317J-9 TaxID=2932250 RepID=UPI001FD67A82|nr:SusE domain-containing protein [Hymenobacter sp. 5317J-9]UOQ96161.1 SusE domain-containing protein [Hymenobacter sp. 5317J-9]